MITASASATAILVHLAGSVALLIWAVRLVRTGAMRAFGGSLRQAPRRLHRNRFSAFGSGVGGDAGPAEFDRDDAADLLLRRPQPDRRRRWRWRCCSAPISARHWRPS